MRRITFAALFLPLLCLGDRPGLGQGQPPPRVPALDPGGAQKDPRLAAVPLGPNLYTVVQVEFTSPASCEAACKLLKSEHPRGAHVFVRFQKFADLFLSAEQAGNGLRLDKAGNQALEAVVKAKGYFWHDFDSTIELPPPPKKIPLGGARGKAEEIVKGPFRGLTGKGVIVAVLDTGIDFHLPDFIDKKGGSRLLYYWDTLASTPKPGDPGTKAPTPVQYPNGVGIGALYTRQELTEAIRTKDRRRIKRDDSESGHGTACATIAVGNGSTKKVYGGVAPEADVIAVRLGRRDNMDNGYLLNAICGWLDEVARAENKSLVVSCSFGGTCKGHDGNTIEERQLNARFPLKARGRALCISAGNNGYEPIHAEARGDADQPAQLTWKAPAGGAALELYFDTDRPRDVAVNCPQAIGAGKAYLHKPSGQVRTWLNVPAGEGRLTCTCAKPVAIDAYIRGRAAGEQRKAEFLPPGLKLAKVVGSPGSASNALTVASYDWNNIDYKNNPLQVYAGPKKGYVDMRVGALSAYSSPGFSRVHDPKAPKPFLTAPGQYFMVNVPDGDAEFRSFNGTSAATPYVAGVVALVFQANPQLTLGELRTLLARHAKKEGADRFTEDHGSLPNAHWGFGKLNLAAVEAILAEVLPPAAGAARGAAPTPRPFADRPAVRDGIRWGSLQASFNPSGFLFTR